MYNNRDEYFKALQEPREKPVVKYKPIPNCPIVVGYKASVVVSDHPAAYLNAEEWVSTSTVVSYDEATGVFETMNTIYKLEV